MANTTVSFQDHDDAAHSFVLLPVTSGVGRRIDVTFSSPNLPIALEVSGSIAKTTPSRKFSAMRARLAYSETMDDEVSTWGSAPVNTVALDINVPFGSSDTTTLGTSSSTDEFLRRALFFLIQALRGYDNLTTGEVTDLDAILGADGALYNTVALISQGDR